MNDKTMFSGGYNILLAEDDKMNQVVVTGLVKMLNLGRVEIAENGKEALEMFNSHRFDFILMDGEMPEMNGIDAAYAIRAIEKDKDLQRTPIIALTARTTQEDKTLFLNSGMDEFLEKPLHPEALAKAVQNVIRQERFDATPKKPRNLESTLDVQELNRIMGGKKTLLDQCLQAFEADYPPLISKMTSCIEKDAYSELKETAHRLKGMFKYLAARNAAALAEQLESQAGAGDVTSTDLTFQVRMLDEQCLKIIDSIKQVSAEDFS